MFYCFTFLNARVTFRDCSQTELVYIARAVNSEKPCESETEENRQRNQFDAKCRIYTMHAHHSVQNTVQRVYIIAKRPCQIAGSDDSV